MYDFLFFFQRDFYFIFLRSTIGLFQRDFYFLFLRSTIGLFQRDFDSKIMLFFIGVIFLASI